MYFHAKLTNQKMNVLREIDPKKKFLIEQKEKNNNGMNDDIEIWRKIN